MGRDASPRDPCVEATKFTPTAKLAKEAEALQHFGASQKSNMIRIGQNVIHSLYPIIRGRIIGRQPLPPLGEVFSEIRREDCRRSVMMKKKEDETVEKSALVAANNLAPHAAGNTDLATANISAKRPYSNQRRLEDKPRLWWKIPCYSGTM
ncbi:hypothetical protein F0562_030591 [Nyssa sinensis]|uniref:Uncharacterized protein n=1 Tax=Nyssa sinensis TaxID=561372 RepID=A0A5J5AZ87_9ASTE|nr:hypothetical protein F0562_030591 [Nyssa sinensis]